MEEIGPPIAYPALREGTPVYDQDGDRIGVVEHVVADAAVDIFHGLVVHTVPLPGRHLFADADQIAEICERGVLLSVDRGQLHEPSETPTPAKPGAAKPGATRSEGGSMENPLQAGLRHAWDWINRHV